MNHEDIKASTATAVHVDDSKPVVDGFAIQGERERTLEQKKIERKLLLKIDFYILPLLALVYFLASMVRDPASSTINTRERKV